MPTIRVECDLTKETAVVSVEPAHLAIGAEPREPVVWEIRGLPPGGAPRIVWINAIGGESPLGPFNDLLYASSYVLGKGDRERTGAGRYPYQIVVEDAAGKPVVRSEACSIEAAPAKASTVPNAVVLYAGGDLAVEPLLVRVNTGDVVTWYFKDFPPDVYPVIRFRTDPPLGPFSALALAATAVTEEAGVRWVISGAVASDTLETLFYTVEARDAEHQVLAERHDPGIDNMGPPTQP